MPRTDEADQLACSDSPNQPGSDVDEEMAADVIYSIPEHDPRRNTKTFQRISAHANTGFNTIGLDAMDKLRVIKHSECAWTTCKELFPCTENPDNPVVPAHAFLDRLYEQLLEHTVAVGSYCRTIAASDGVNARVCDYYTKLASRVAGYTAMATHRHVADMRWSDVRAWATGLRRWARHIEKVYITAPAAFRRVPPAEQLTSARALKRKQKQHTPAPKQPTGRGRGRRKATGPA